MIWRFDDDESGMMAEFDIECEKTELNGNIWSDDCVWVNWDLFLLDKEISSPFDNGWDATGRNEFDFLFAKSSCEEEEDIVRLTDDEDAVESAFFFPFGILSALFKEIFSKGSNDDTLFV